MGRVKERGGEGEGWVEGGGVEIRGVGGAGTEGGSEKGAGGGGRGRDRRMEGGRE